MAKQNINIGTIVNDGAGDSLRDGAIKINANFNEVYSKLGNGNDLIVLDFTTPPTEGQVLQYNSITDKFVPGEAGARGQIGPQGDKGDKGDQGLQGIVGPQGIQGDPGPRLTVQGSVASTLDLPDNNNEIGDIRIVTATNDAYVWVKNPLGDSSYEWQNIGPLKGDKGDQGLPGAAGPKGDTGDTGPQGSAFVVSGAVTNVVDLPLTNVSPGDFYIVTSTGDGYIWVSPNNDSTYEWVNVGPWQLAGGDTALNSFTTITVAGQSNVVADSSTDTLTLVAGAGIAITTNASTDAITIAATGSGSGELNQNAFSNVAVSGQSTVEADNATDTLTLVAGSGISITTNASTDAITIAATGGMGVSTFAALTDNAGLTIDRIYLPAITMLSTTNNGASSYRFDQYGTADNPTVYAINGTTIAFNLNVVGHPFLIQTSGGSNYNEGLTHVTTAGVVTTGSSAQGQTSGTLYWKIPSSISGNYRYICSIHSGMVGVIAIKDFSAI
jgi:plastocyanin